jgi:hypothetical protein
MSRRRYRFNEETQQMEEVGADWTDAERRALTPTEELTYGGLGTSTDGTPINSRTKHREYMKRNNLTVADDYKGVWEKAAKEREAFYRGDSAEQRRDAREDVGRAIYEARRRRK